jgi:prolyl oligopeptidase
MTIGMTRKVDQRDDFHGTEVADPYRWLEDQNSPEVSAWAHEQADYAQAHLSTLPGRARISERLTELLALPASGTPRLRGGLWFRETNDGKQQQSVLRASTEPMGEGHVVVDPNEAGADATTSLAGAVADPTGRLVAWSYKEAGSDWSNWKVRQLDETGATIADLTDELPWAKFVQPCWLADSSGFVYAVYPAADENDRYSSANGASKLLLHVLGTDQDADRLLFHRPDRPGLHCWPWVDRDGGWLVTILEDSDDDTRAIWIQDLDDPADELHELVPPGQADWEFVDADERGIILRTDLEAERGRLVLLDRRTGELTTLVAERDGLLDEARLAGDMLVISWLVDACSQVTVHDLAGNQTGTVELPSLGSVIGISASDESSLVHFNFTSFDTPPQVLAHDLATGTTDVVFSSRPDKPGPELVTDQIWITSADGTRLPAFVVHRADVTAANGPHPTTLYGYGGFRISLSPAFSSQISTFAELGGVWVVANLRGGSEFGSAWHDGGRLANKQNVFDDAIATAEYLIAQGWTSTDQLAINGGSNGGLLVGALFTQRPDLFAAAVAQVGVLDMLRYEEFTIGRAWAPDYGIASRSKEEFDYLYAYSPYHRLRENADYPPMLLMTSDHDDRVVPAHSFKFAARLQAVSDPDASVYLRVEFGAGHGLGKSRSTLLAERTDLLAFIAAHTGLKL